MICLKKIAYYHKFKRVTKGEKPLGAKMIFKFICESAILIFDPNDQKNSFLFITPNLDRWSDG